MDTYFYFLLITVILFFISIKIQTRANKALTSEKKVELINEFSSGQISRFLPLLGLLIFYFLNFKFNWIKFPLINYLFFGSLLIFLLISLFTNYKKMRKLNFENNFITTFLIASALRLIAIGFLLFSLLNLD